MSFYADAPAELLYAMPGVGGAVTNTVSTGGAAAGGPLLGGGGSGVGSAVPACEIPHNYFSKQGKSILVEAVGVYSLGAVIPTMRFSVYADNTVGTLGTQLLTTGAFTAGNASVAAASWYMKALMTCYATGPNGALQTWGWLNWGMISGLSTTVSAPQVSYVMGAANTVPVTFNTQQTTPVYLDLYASWSTSTTGPSITMTQMFVWGLN